MIFKKGMIQKRFLLPFSLCIVLCSLRAPPCAALDFSLRPKGFVFIPAGPGTANDDGNALYSVGGGGDLGFEFDLSSMVPNPLGLGYTLGLEGGGLFSKVPGDDPKNLSIISFGGGLGLYFFPLSRLLTRIDGAIGGYQPSFDGENGYAGLFWRLGGEVGFRFTPALSLAANAGLRQFRIDSTAFNTGVYAGLSAQITFQTGQGSSREGVGVSLDQYGAMYPVFMQLYQTSALGNLVIRNNENAEIRDVQVSFRAAPYTASEFPCGTVSLIPRGRAADLPLLADFSTDILRFTDEGRILGEVIIRYRFLGEAREALRTVILSTNNRNRVTQGDAAALAAFISPTSPDMLDYAKYIAGLARANRRTGHNWNFQYALWLLEGLRAGGVRLGDTYAAEEETQFPAETLSYRTGNSRDLALLFAAALECVGIPSAFIQTENDFLVAVSLDSSQSGAETMFNGLDKILIVNDEVWLPLSMSAFNDGFQAAWAQGAAALNDAFNTNQEAEFVIVEDAWAVYPPAPLPEQGGNAIRTDSDATTNRVNRVMQQYIDQELQPLLQKMLNNPPAGMSGAALQNRLGILYVRTGRISDGKAAYERAAGMGSVPAMTNRGNLALIEQDYAAAERWFNQALSRDSGNTAALRGLEQIEERR